jgi:signal transduction histidine kinase
MAQADWKEVEYFKTLHESLARSIAELTEADDIWKFVTDTISFSAATLPCSGAAMFLLDEYSEKVRLAFAVEKGFSLDLFKDVRLHELQVPFSIEGWPLWREIFLRNRACWRDLSKESELSQQWLIPLYRRFELKKTLSVPLKFSSQPIGIVCFGFAEDNVPTPENIELTETLAREAALAIQLLRTGRRAMNVEVFQKELVAAAQVHEQLAQCLATISLYLAATESQASKNPAIASDALRKAQELSQLGMKLARETSSVLSPGKTRALDISGVLRSVILEAKEEADAEIDFLELGTAARSIPFDVTKGLSGMVREAIVNGVKHGKAHRILVSMNWYVEKLCISILDNGVGFDSTKIDQLNEGYGISGMRDRARRMSGRLEIDSNPGVGTEIRVTVPIVNL